MGFTLSVPDKDYRINSLAAVGPQTPDAPSTFEGAGTAVGTALVGGLADVKQTAGDTLAASARANAEIGLLENPWADPTGEGLAQLRAEQPDPHANDHMEAVHAWARADPTSQGAGARLLGSTARGVEIMGLGTLFGGPVAGAGTLAATEGYTDLRESRAAGVDETTALKKAAITTAFTGAGAFLPFHIGGGAAKGLAGLGMSAEVAGNATLATSLYGAARAAATVAANPVAKLGTAALVNTGFGMTDRYFTSSVLADAGYKEMAEQYAPTDSQAMAADFIMGLAFGAHAQISEHLAERQAGVAAQPPASLIESALASRKEDMLTRNGAGVAIDPMRANLDTRLQDEALNNLLRGRDTGVSAEDARTMIEGALPDPARGAINDEFIGAMHDEHGLLADFTEPKLGPEPERVYAPEPAPVEGAPAEPAGTASVSPIAAESLRQLAANHADMPVELGNGVTVTAAELPGILSREMAAANGDAKLHDVAMACFLRTQ